MKSKQPTLKITRVHTPTFRVSNLEIDCIYVQRRNCGRGPSSLKRIRIVRYLGECTSAQLDEGLIVWSQAKIPLPFYLNKKTSNRTISSRRELHQRGTTNKSSVVFAFIDTGHLLVSVIFGRRRFPFRSNAPVKDS